MPSAQGIDLSSWQQPLTSVSGLDFVFVKATEGTSWIDPHFAANWDFLASKPVRRGAYHFLHPSLPVDQQVELFMSVVASHGLRRGDMLAGDFEISIGMDGMLLMDPGRISRSVLLQPDSKGHAVVRPGVSRSYSPNIFWRNLTAHSAAMQVSSVSRQFLDEVTTATEVAAGGRYCPVLCYSYLDFLPNLATCTSYPLWLAAYARNAPASVAPWDNWTLWQWSGGGGPGGADQDAFNGDKAAMDRWISTYTGNKPAPPPAQNWTEKLVQELPTLQEGATGQDVRTIQACLTARGETTAIDGVFGPQTRTALVKFQAARGLTADGIAGPRTWPKLLNR